AQPVAFRSGERDQRAGAGRYHRRETGPDDQSRPATAGIRLSSLRRLDAMWKLALFRLLDRSRRDDPASRNRGSVRSRNLSELGLVVAVQSPRALQPRVVRCRRQALGCGSPPDLVERSATALA